MTLRAQCPGQDDLSNIPSPFDFIIELSASLGPGNAAIVYDQMTPVNRKLV